MTNTESPLTPDVDLPGQQRDQADLDIVVKPEPEGARENDPGVSPPSMNLERQGTKQMTEVGNTLIRPENS